MFYPVGALDDIDCGTPSVGIEGEANFVEMQRVFDVEKKKLNYSKSVLSTQMMMATNSVNFNSSVSTKKPKNAGSKHRFSGRQSPEESKLKFQLKHPISD